MGDFTSVGVIVTALGILVGFWQFNRTRRMELEENNKKRFVDVFSAYTDRYDRIMKEFPEDARSSANLKTISQEQCYQLIKIFRRYMNLCSEELFLMNEGYVDKACWTIWEKGIKSTIQDLPIFQKIWQLYLKKEYCAFPQFVRLVDSMVSELNNEMEIAIALGKSGDYEDEVETVDASPKIPPHQTWPDNR